MDKRHKHPERADQARGIQADEARRPDRRAHGRTFTPRRLRARSQRVAVGPEAAVARVVLDQQREPATERSRERAQREIGAAPPQHRDQE